MQIQVQGDSVAAVLAATRGAAGLSTRELAAKVGVSHATIAAWENGKGEPSVSQFIRWAQATNQPAELLLGGLIDVVRLEGLEPPTFWLGVAWSRFRQRFTRSGAFWTPERRSILAEIARQFQTDSEIPTGSGAAQ